MTIDEAIEFAEDINATVTFSSEAKLDEEFFVNIPDWLEELKIFQELYPDTDVKGSLRKNYEQGRTDAIRRDYNTILIYEDTIRSMLLNTNPENNLIEWVDLNGKLNAITHIRHLLYNLEQ